MGWSTNRLRSAFLMISKGALIVDINDLIPKNT